MKTLVIIAHPNLEKSRINKRWQQELAKHQDKIVVHELYKNYPDFKINVEEEQKLLEKYQRIVLQFPIFWYSYPPLLKKWFDDVFSYGWAYGPEGNKLNNKKFSLAVSLGGTKEIYKNANIEVDNLLLPFTATVMYIGAQKLPSVFLYGAVHGVTDEEVENSAVEYVKSII